MKINAITPSYTPQNLEKLFKAQINMFPKDIPYRKALAKELKIKPQFEWVLRPIIGLEEFTAAMKSFSVKHFSPGVRKSITNANEREFDTLKGNFRANPHWHSKYCDGDMFFKDGLDQSVKMANLNAQLLTKNSPAPYAPFITSNTTHDGIRASLEALESIKEDPFKYRNLRYILGMEISATAQEGLPRMHILNYAFNPFDPTDIESNGVIDILKGIQKSEFGIADIAHPARLYNTPIRESEIINATRQIFDAFKLHAKDKTIFIENNYGSYYGEKIQYAKTIEEISKKYKTINTGGLDSHGNNIFTATKDLSDKQIKELTTIV